MTVYVKKEKNTTLEKGVNNLMNAMIEDYTGMSRGYSFAMDRKNEINKRYAEEITGTLARQYWPIMMDGKKNKTMEEFAMKEFDYGYGSAKAEIEEFGMDDDMKEVFEIYTEDPEDFLNIVPGTLKGMYPEFTKGYMQYCKEYMNKNG